ncbi:MAG TPA: ATP-binding cassette domain-containing protein, partial [Tepidisphaeraceae bacterium]|nr:ATP-binding cassette domain-containing protein [Tepidisphaeraceae bacterium]
MTSPLAVQTDRLTHAYGPRIALHELTLSVSAGEVVGLLGPNGSGKTTLFRILSTLVPPADGRAAVFGLDLAARRDEVRKRIGVVFQNPSLDKQLTAAENLRYHGHLYGLRGADLEARITDLLGRVDLLDRAGERVLGFSGGMRRRVEIAKGLIHRPRLLLLDEPSTGLDPLARADVWRYLDEVRRRDGVTALLTTHLMDEADRCDRVAILNAGKLAALGTPAELKERVGGDVITITTRHPAAVRAAMREKLGVTPDKVTGADGNDASPQARAGAGPGGIGAGPDGAGAERDGAGAERD